MIQIHTGSGDNVGYADTIVLQVKILSQVEAKNYFNAHRVPTEYCPRLVYHGLVDNEGMVYGILGREHQGSTVNGVAHSNFEFLVPDWLQRLEASFK